MEHILNMDCIIFYYCLLVNLWTFNSDGLMVWSTNFQKTTTVDLSKTNQNDWVSSLIFPSVFIFPVLSFFLYLFIYSFLFLFLSSSPTFLISFSIHPSIHPSIRPSIQLLSSHTHVGLLQWWCWLFYYIIIINTEVVNRRKSEQNRKTADRK